MMQHFESGMAVGLKHFAQIEQKGSRWLSRHVPSYIRDHLLVPYYFTHEPGTDVLCLWVIQYPIQSDEKVHFVRFALAPHETKETGPLPDRSQ